MVAWEDVLPGLAGPPPRMSPLTDSSPGLLLRLCARCSSVGKQEREVMEHGLPETAIKVCACISQLNACMVSFENHVSPCPALVLLQGTVVLRTQLATAKLGPTWSYDLICHPPHSLPLGPCQMWAVSPGATPAVWAPSTCRPHSLSLPVPGQPQLHQAPVPLHPRQQLLLVLAGGHCPCHCSSLCSLLSQEQAAMDHPPTGRALCLVWGRYETASWTHD